MDIPDVNHNMGGRGSIAREIPGGRVVVVSRVEVTRVFGLPWYSRSVRRVIQGESFERRTRKY